MGLWENTEGRGFNFVYTYITPGHDLLFTPGPFTQARLLPGYTPSWNNLVYASPVTGAGGSHRDNAYSMTVEDRLPGGYTLTSITSYSQERQNQVQDLFAVNDFFWQTLTGQTVFFNTQSQNTTVKQQSEELKIVSPTDQAVSWLAGLFYSDVAVDEIYLRTLPPAGLNDHVIPDTKTYDAYARATWNITSATSLVTGLRFNHDAIKYLATSSDSISTANGGTVPFRKPSTTSSSL
jgi:iron complex outermembrane recepter protein